MTSLPQTSRLVLKSNGQLFIDNDSNHINLQHLGLVSIPGPRKAEWFRILNARAAAAAAVGAEFLFLLAPDKQSVYRHCLPPSYRSRVASFLLDHPSVIDVAPALAGLAQVADVYPRTDSHWNQLGAHVAALAVESRRGRNLNYGVVGWDEPVTPGDLGHKLEPVQQSGRLTARVAHGATLVHDNMVPNNGRVRIFSKAAGVGADPTRLLLFGDSFSYDLVAVLKEAFDITVQIHSFAVDHSVLRAFRPNLLLVELTERFVFRLPEISDGHVLPALWMQKIVAGERIEATRGATPDQISTLPAAARDTLSYFKTMFEPFRRDLQRDRTAADGVVAPRELATTVDDEVYQPGLRDNPSTVRDILRGLSRWIPDDCGTAFTLYAAASRPAEAASLLTRLNGETPLFERMTQFPPALQPLFLRALRNAGWHSALVSILSRGRSREWHAQVLAFALEMVTQTKHRACRVLAARIADRLAAAERLGSVERQVLCRYLLGGSDRAVAMSRLEAYIADCDTDPWPVLTLARLQRADGNWSRANGLLAPAAKRMPRNHRSEHLLAEARAA